jgi:hypothetical protein
VFGRLELSKTLAHGVEEIVVLMVMGRNPRCMAVGPGVEVVVVGYTPTSLGFAQVARLAQ